METDGFEAVGNLLTRYTLLPGEGIPMHTHDYEHLTIVLRGRVRIDLPEESFELAHPERVVFRRNRPHAIIAIEPDTEILNVTKIGTRG